MARDDFLNHLKRLAKKSPEENIQVIIRLAGSVSQLTPVIKERELKIKHQYKILQAVSVEGTAGQIVALSKESWVVKIEEDKGVEIANNQ